MTFYTKAATVIQGSKEMQDLMTNFEKTIGKVVFTSCDFCREDKPLWNNGHYYCNGKVNDLFLAFMRGYVYCKSAYNDGVFD